MPKRCIVWYSRQPMAHAGRTQRASPQPSHTHPLLIQSAAKVLEPHMTLGLVRCYVGVFVHSQGTQAADPGPIQPQEAAEGVL